MSPKSPYETLTFYLMAAATFFLDQLTKLGIVAALALGHSQPLVDGVLNLTYVQNTGAAFSLFAGHPEKLGLFAVLVVLGVMLYQRRTQPKELIVVLAMGLFIGGALGNAVDRLMLGYVRDMFDLQWQGQNVFPIFNVADIAVNLAAGMFVLHTFLTERKQENQAS
jgi:lipoprotein signal peptidase